MRGWFGIASLESLSHGKPVIAGLDEWNIRCIKDFTGAAALPWVIAGNVDQLRTKIEGLVKDGQLRKEIGTKSRRFMEDHWTERQALGILLEVYKDL
jgi:glycosyltransferase involved in cell wall biosynthesis